MSKWSIYNNNSKEFCALNSNNHLLKSKHVKTGAYFKALVATKVDLRMWHRRLAYLGKRNVIKTSKLVDGIAIDLSVLYSDELYDPCELGTPL